VSGTRDTTDPTGARRRLRVRRRPSPRDDERPLDERWANNRRDRPPLSYRPEWGTCECNHSPCRKPTAVNFEPTKETNG
jgi:hypothetical protein